MTQTKTVHDALQMAQIRAFHKEMRNYSFKAGDQDLLVAQEICERHGITLGAFLRECVTCLINDYMPAKE